MKIVGCWQLDISVIIEFLYVYFCVCAQAGDPAGPPAGYAGRGGDTPHPHQLCPPPGRRDQLARPLRHQSLQLPPEGERFKINN